jgi:hypothetical protein
MLHHRFLFAADVLPYFTSIRSYRTGRRNKIKMRKEEEAEMIARECNISVTQRQKLYSSPTFVFISGNKTLVVDWQSAGTLSF